MPQEIGRVGQKRYAGVFYEEFLSELSGTRGIETFKEMANNDDIIFAMLYAIEMLLRQTEFNVEPASSKSVDKDAAEFVEGCMNDMQATWQDTLSEILSFITYGWSYHEIVYKRRCGRSKDPRYSSKYDDRLIGWRKLPVRSQDTLSRWEYDPVTDELRGMVQVAPPDYAEVLVPIEKALHFRTRSAKENPEGRSVLRGAYRDWYFKKRMQEIEGIGVERDLAGFPVMHAPPGVDIWDRDDPEMVKMLANAERIVTSIRRDTQEGIVLPDGWGLELLSAGGKRNFDTNQIIDRYDKRIAMTTLSDFILLGQQSTGSFALSSNKTELFGTAMGTYLDIVCDVFNTQAIPRLVDLNAEHFAGFTDYPRMTHGDIEDVDLTALGGFLNQVVGCGALIPDEGLDDYLRQAAHLPERVDNYVPPTPPVDNDVGGNAARNVENDETDPLDGEDS
ncbi:MULTISPECIES: phage portal protein family protein [Caproicibacterium]|uniref:Mu-like prophage protein gp29 n=1 Tax=Caproicibacterium argilliputei TaxID=3030016 RepID=A0AA97DAW3_9FIRM|nr:hypothetical protein [Caproicibacterium argilliputei]WOC33469.1 hypothetical protein PXC00_06275 [Caproicibacterium argilliputei]